MILTVLIILLFWLLLGFIAGMPIYLVCRCIMSYPAGNEEEELRRRRRLVRVYWPIWMAFWLVGTALLPAPGRPREKARRAYCLSNLKQIGLGMAMYADTYNGRLPMDAENPTLVGCIKLLSNIVTSAKVYRCPDDWRSALPVLTYDQLTTNNISYSYVPNLIWQDHPDSIVALDRIYATRQGSKWSPTGNHKDAGGNVLFDDGHVSWVNALPSALKDKDGKQIVLSP